MKNQKYSLEVTTKQLRVIEDALDLYTRVGIAQLEIVGEKINILFPNKVRSHWELKEKYLDHMKKEVFGFDPGESYGIGCKEVSDRAHIGYDLQKTIQKAIADKEKHEGSSVWKDGNILHLGSEPIAKCSSLE